MREDDWPAMMTVEEVAPRLRMSPAGVRRLVRRGEIKASRVGRRWLISRAEVLRVLAEGTHPVELAGGRQHPGRAPEPAEDNEAGGSGGAELSPRASWARSAVEPAGRLRVPRVIG